MVQSDTLSRRPNHHPSKEEENLKETLLGPDWFISAVKIDLEGLYDTNLRTEIAQNGNLNHKACEVLQNTSTSSELTTRLLSKGWEKKLTKEEPLLLYQVQVYVPEDTKLC
jgi:hypothetical protein